MAITVRFHPGPLEREVMDAVDLLVERDAVARIAARDHTLWQAGPEDCADRLGWLDAPSQSEAVWPELVAQADDVADGVDRVVVLGMGGSSLFPEVIAEMFERSEGFPELVICDTTHPAAVQRLLGAGDPERTFVVVASKSGSTIETRSHLAWIRDRFEAALGARASSRFGAITDPGSPLDADAEASGFRHVWRNNPEIGGRYSALSLFGMVPAALAGLDGEELLAAAVDEAESLLPLGETDDARDHHGVLLGALMAAGAGAGRDQLTVVSHAALSPFGPWLEQLIAESTGKHGVGVVPVVGEPLDLVIATPAHRVAVVMTPDDVEGGEAERLVAAGMPVVELRLEEPADLGGAVLLWEWATALCGAVLGINPFDQPDVEAAKVAARAVLDAPDHRSESADDGALAGLAGMMRPGDHLALCAFVDPAFEPELQAARIECARRWGLVTTLGIGPRFLHSTGQLHKGGSDRIVVVQVVAPVPDDQDLVIPGTDLSFGRLLLAQADGDLAALRAAGRRVIRVDLAAFLSEFTG